jgi:hypothetical protein
MSAWTDQIWGAVERNGVARRKVASVLRYGGWLTNDGMGELIRDAKKRKYHVAIVGEQVFIFRHAIDVQC